MTINNETFLVTAMFHDEEPTVEVRWHDRSGEREEFVVVEIGHTSMHMTPRAARNLVQKLAAVHQAAVEEHITRSLTASLP